MYCEDCAKRETCTQLCHELGAYLSSECRQHRSIAWPMRQRHIRGQTIRPQIVSLSKPLDAYRGY